jgi:hypothetical protein
MSNLPKQVQAQADAVAELDKMFEQPAPTEQEQVEAVQEPAVEQAPAAEKPKSDDDTWQKRYQTLQGMFNAEVPRLNSQVKELTTQLQTAIASIEALKKQPQKQEKPVEKLVTEKDVEAYGGELIDLVKRQAAEVIQSERATIQDDLAKLQAENAELKKMLGGVAEKQGANERRAYYVELASQVPEYEAINTNPDFLTWLAEVDPLSGVTRQAYLNVAFEQFDAKRTATLFNAFKKDAGLAAQPKQDAKQELQRQVAPGTSRASAPTTPNAGEKIWAMRDIEQFYTEASKGRYSREEAARIEAEIDAAVAAGRIR